MMILDLNNILFSSLLIFCASNKNVEITDDLIRHIVLNQIRSLNVKFRPKYGELIISTDSMKYWRREFFPYYKAARKKAREESALNWPQIFKATDIIKEELRTILPYKYVEVEGAEADDIIGHFCHWYASRHPDQPQLVLSSDKDFKQLQCYKNVEQYDPVHKKWITTDDPGFYLHEHILKGDSGDGIPNVASPDNCFVIGERQKRMTKKLMDELSTLSMRPEHSLYRNYIRNKTLIDLEKTPQSIKNNISAQLSAVNEKDRSKLFGFFTQKRLRQLTESLNDF